MRATLRLSSPAWLAQPRITSSSAAQSTRGRRSIRARDRDRGEVVGADGRERAAVAAERGADRRRRSRPSQGPQTVGRAGARSQAGELRLVDKRAGGQDSNGRRAMAFKLTYSTMFDPPEEMHARFEAALAAAARGPRGDPRAPRRRGRRGRRANLREAQPGRRGGSCSGRFPLAERGDVDRAMAAAQPRLRRLARHAARRAGAAGAAARPALIEERVYAIAAALALEVGKNRMEALGETQETADFFSGYARELERNQAYDQVAARRPARRLPLPQPQRAEALRGVGRDHALQLPPGPRRGPGGGGARHRQHRRAEGRDRHAVGGTAARRLHPRRGLPAGVFNYLTRPRQRRGRSADRATRDLAGAHLHRLPRRRHGPLPQDGAAAPTRAPASPRWAARTPAS